MPTTRRRPTRRSPRRLTARPARRRGVTSILAMMFMVLFGSLAAAMAIVSKGNLSTAQSHLRVSAALGAVDTGMDLAAGRLRRAAAQMRVWKGEVDASFASALWDGTFVADPDQPIVSPGGLGLRDLLATTHPAAGDPGTIDLEPEYTAQSDWLVTAPLVLDEQNGQVTTAAQITYAPEPVPGTNRLGVRAVVTGYAWDYRSQRWVRRVAQQVFEIDKNPRQAVLGPSKIMIGKNVQINGPLGARFMGVDNVNGHPLVVKSDFFGMNPVLDQKLQDYYDAVVASDTDGDSRLRSLHAVESQSLADLASNYYDDGSGGDENNTIVDYTGDGRVDEYDIFLKHYDGDGDGRVALSDDLRAGGPHAGLSPEFDGVDEELARLIDEARPDRNGDGVVDERDTKLGYGDGVLDERDRYAKINGPTMVRAQRSAWEAQQDEFGVTLDDYQKQVQGVIRSDDEEPVSFDVGDDELPPIETDTFDSASSDLAQAADGAAFTIQAGVDPIWTLDTNSDGVVVGQTLNSAFYTASSTDDIGVVVEPTPFGAPAPADWYERPVFKNMTFKNVVLPMGLNALFVDCTFIGVTRVQSYADNTHQAWQFYGQQLSDLSLKYPPLPAESSAQLDNDYFPADGSIVQPPGFDVPRLTVNGTPYVTTKPLSNNIRFHGCTFIGSIVADKPNHFTHIRNKLQFTGGTKFLDEHPDSPENPELNPDEDDLDEIAKSSMMLPQYSVDVGENNAPTGPDGQNVNLKGVVIAGVLDVRGVAEIDGTLLLTFEPADGDPALMHFGQQAGNPADFNTTLGYFGAQEGDEEGLAPFEYNGQQIVGFDTDGDGRVDTTAFEDGATPVPFNGYGRIRLNWDPDLIMPDGLVAPIQIEPVPATYQEGRAIPGASP